MNKKQLVLVSESGKVPIKLEGVFDVTVSQAPGSVERFFDDAVTIGHEYRGEFKTTTIEAEGETIDRFRNVLFKALLNETRVSTQNPTLSSTTSGDESYHQGTLQLRKRALVVNVSGRSIEIDFGAVSKINRREHTIDGDQWAALRIDHVVDGATVATLIALRSSRKMNLLGRYIRLEYAQLKDEVGEMELSNDEVKTLATLSASDHADLARTLELKPGGVTMLLNSLESKGLVIEADGATALTSRGKLAVNEHNDGVDV